MIFLENLFPAYSGIKKTAASFQKQPFLFFDFLIIEASP
jgi:hypothetical protein